MSRQFSIEKSGYFFFGLLVLAIAGFWPSYFSKFFDGTADFTFYFHFHAVIALLWILLLIIQPMLVMNKKAGLHRLVGKVSYIIMPLLFISVLLLVHSRSQHDGNISVGLWITFKDLVILAFAYGVAIVYRKTMLIHAKGMIAAGIVLIEPALIRFISNTLSSIVGQNSYPITIGIVYSILIGLMIIERKHTAGRWVFPVVLMLYIIAHSVVFIRIEIELWKNFAEWFASLPLT